MVFKSRHRGRIYMQVLIFNILQWTQKFLSVAILIGYYRNSTKNISCLFYDMFLSWFWLR